MCNGATICVLTPRYVSWRHGILKIIAMQPTRTLIYFQNIVSFVLIAGKMINIQSWIISLSGHAWPQDETDMAYSIVKNKKC